MEVSRHDNPGTVYWYSSSAATADDPIVIHATGRKLEASDRPNRTDLQKFWLQTYVPNDYDLHLREQSMCPARAPREFGDCAEYIFIDTHGNQHSYFFYLGNWFPPEPESTPKR